MGAEFGKVQAAASALADESDSERGRGLKKRFSGLGKLFRKSGSGGGDTDNESVSSKSSRVQRGLMKHSLLLDDESSVSHDSDQF
jgi:hypothetical protein